MAADRLISVLGLGFGDCGKGLCTDHLVRRVGAHTVVRFNGGAQAGHNVVLADGRQHTFSQFGAGTFSTGVVTVLSHPVVVHPTALLEEARVLEGIGVADALGRLLVDPRCRITTPSHQALGRLREWNRGNAAHGSCGAGFGETVDHALQHPDEALYWGDLALPGRAAAKLEAIGARLREAAAPWRNSPSHVATEDLEWHLLDSDVAAGRWLSRACDVWSRAASSLDAVLQRLSLPGTLVFEGAQGALLDERHGFHPHTTWSSTGTQAVEQVVGEAGRPSQVDHVGVLRTYLTRHGAGPMPTEDAALDFLTEPHNGAPGWQGRFRRGHVDEMLLRYALDTVGPLQGIALTHVDAIAGPAALRWCTSYRADATLADPSICDVDRSDPGHVVGLRATDDNDLVRMARMTRLLQSARPDYDEHSPRSLAAFVERVATVTQLPILMMSSGPTAKDVSSTV